MRTHNTIGRFGLFSALVMSLILSAANVVFAQTSEFTFQGKLPSNFNPATGVYQMEFKLFDAATAGNQIGTTVSNANVSVTQSAFTVNLDFGAAAFPGADRYLEVAVRKTSSDPYTILSPRQKMTSSPYSIKSKAADTAAFAVTADTANVATRAFNSTLFAGQDPSRFVRYDDSDNVGIGTTSNGSKLAVGGLIESKAGGFKFPDATTQATAGITSVNTNATLTGNGTSASPLGVASPLMVRDLDHPARQPFSAKIDETGFVTYVPEGKRLVIETVTGRVTKISAYVSHGGIDFDIRYGYTGTTYKSSFYVAPSFTRHANGDTTTYYTHSLRVYLVPGDRLFGFPPTSFSSYDVWVTGYWVDVP